MSKKGEKITIPETDPISDSERKQLDHIYEKMGDRIKEAGMDELILLRFIRGTSIFLHISTKPISLKLKHIYPHNNRRNLSTCKPAIPLNSELACNMWPLS